MSNCSAHRRALPPPIRSQEAALTALNLACDDGRDTVVAVACLDRQRRPLTMFIVEGGNASAEQVRQALGVLIDSIRDATTPLEAVILAASRPGTSAFVTDDDVLMWPLLHAACNAAGVLLVDYFILGDGWARAVSAVVEEDPPW